MHAIYALGLEALTVPQLPQTPTRYSCKKLAKPILLMIEKIFWCAKDLCYGVRAGRYSLTRTSRDGTTLKRQESFGQKGTLVKVKRCCYAVLLRSLRKTLKVTILDASSAKQPIIESILRPLSSEGMSFHCLGNFLAVSTVSTASANNNF